MTLCVVLDRNVTLNMAKWDASSESLALGFVGVSL